MKKLFIILVLFCGSLGNNSIYSQNIINFDATAYAEILEGYWSSIDNVESFFGNKMLRALLGERDLLNKRFDSFDLARLNNENLRLLRNMIYAKYGLRFQSNDLNSYFGKFNWYKPLYNNVDNLLNEIDRWNIELISVFEKRNENLQNIIWPGYLYGSFQDDRQPGSFSGFTISRNNKMDYFYDGNSMGVFRKTSGDYVIRGNVLEYRVNKIYFKLTTEIVHSWGPSHNNYYWDYKKLNTITLEDPIVFRFPISDIEIDSNQAGIDKLIISMKIGGIIYDRHAID